MKAGEGGATVEGEIGFPDQGDSGSSDGSDKVGKTTW